MDDPEIKQHWAKTRNKKGRKTDMQHDWTKPAAKAIPKEGFFEEAQGRYGPIFPRTPACYGFTIIAKIKPGTEQTIRAYGKKIAETIDEHLPATVEIQDTASEDQLQLVDRRAGGQAIGIVNIGGDPAERPDQAGEVAVAGGPVDPLVERHAVEAPGILPR
jgi:hypothetical protein